MLRLTILLSIFMVSCCYDDFQKPIDTVGMQPIYFQIGDDISKEAKSFQDLTNIVTYQELILAMENNIGVHIIDNSDPVNPTNILFVPIAGANDIAIKDDILIVNAGETLISIDISDRTKAIFVAFRFVEETDSEGLNFFPSNYHGLFECVDPEKGIVLDWNLIQMNDSDCWR